MRYQTANTLTENEITLPKNYDEGSYNAFKKAFETNNFLKRYALKLSKNPLNTVYGLNIPISNLSILLDVPSLFKAFLSSPNEEIPVLRVRLDIPQYNFLFRGMKKPTNKTIVELFGEYIKKGEIFPSSYLRIYNPSDLISTSEDPTVAIFGADELYGGIYAKGNGYTDYLTPIGGIQIIDPTIAPSNVDEISLSRKKGKHQKSFYFAFDGAGLVLDYDLLKYEGCNEMKGIEDLKEKRFKYVPLSAVVKIIMNKKNAKLLLEKYKDTPLFNKGKSIGDVIVPFSNNSRKDILLKTLASIIPEKDVDNLLKPRYNLNEKDILALNSLLKSLSKSYTNLENIRFIIPFQISRGKLSIGDWCNLTKKYFAQLIDNDDQQKDYSILERKVENLAYQELLGDPYISAKKEVEKIRKNIDIFLADHENKDAFASL